MYRALKAYEQLLANTDSDSDQAMLPIVTSIVTTAHVSGKSDVVTRVLEDFKEHKLDILIGCLQGMLGRYLPANGVVDGVIEKLNNENHEWLRQLDSIWLHNIFKYASRSNNITLMSECMKTWEPSTSVFLPPFIYFIFLILFYLILSLDINRASL